MAFTGKTWLTGSSIVPSIASKDNITGRQVKRQMTVCRDRQREIDASHAPDHGFTPGDDIHAFVILFGGQFDPKRPVQIRFKDHLGLGVVTHGDAAVTRPDVDGNGRFDVKNLDV